MPNIGKKKALAYQGRNKHLPAKAIQGKSRAEVMYAEQGRIKALDPVGILGKIATGESIPTSLQAKDGTWYNTTVRPTISEQLRAAEQLLSRYLPSLKSMELTAEHTVTHTIDADALSDDDLANLVEAEYKVVENKPDPAVIQQKAERLVERHLGGLLPVDWRRAAPEVQAKAAELLKAQGVTS